MGSFIFGLSADLWPNFSGRANFDTSNRVLFYFRTVSYGEYECYGPGSDATNRVAYGKQLKQSEAAPYMTTSYINGEDWLLDIPSVDQTPYIQFHSLN